jgi:hypothetical protein
LKALHPSQLRGLSGYLTKFNVSCDTGMPESNGPSCRWDLRHPQPVKGRLPEKAGRPRPFDPFGLAPKFSRLAASDSHSGSKGYARPVLTHPPSWAWWQEMRPILHDKGITHAECPRICRTQQGISDDLSMTSTGVECVELQEREI